MTPGNLTDSQVWNRYAYARDNSLRFVDPAGRSFYALVDRRQYGQLVEWFVGIMLYPGGFEMLNRLQQDPTMIVIRNGEGPREFNNKGQIVEMPAAVTRNVELGFWYLTVDFNAIGGFSDVHRGGLVTAAHEIYHLNTAFWFADWHSGQAAARRQDATDPNPAESWGIDVDMNYDHLINRMWSEFLDELRSMADRWLHSATPFTDWEGA